MKFRFTKFMASGYAYWNLKVTDGDISWVESVAARLHESRKITAERLREAKARLRKTVSQHKEKQNAEDSNRV